MKILVICKSDSTKKTTKLLHLNPEKKLDTKILFSFFNINFLRTLIYPLTDWRGKPGLTIGIIVGLIFVAVPLFYSFHYGLYVLRKTKIKECNKSYEDDDEEVEME